MPPQDRLLTRLVYLRTAPVVGRLVQDLLHLVGVEIPVTVQIGPGLMLRHAMGGSIVIHPKTRIGRDVTLYHRTTLGRADIWQAEDPTFAGFVVEDEVIVGTGAAVLGRRGALTLGARSVVGANAVLTQSTGQGEIWAGNPAVRVGSR